MPRKRSTSPRKLPQQDRSRMTVEAILEATTHILTEEGWLCRKNSLKTNDFHPAHRLKQLLQRVLR